ncbi:helix-turn-helix domain-containing protein [Sunxiuqinia sp. sy24]|uniref:helix-turn-helix domain-containing protein n=1 Tax=Sunxiuqinia sp. sy24 TaxID=3461495 RepID=UPI0040454275
MNSRIQRFMDYKNITASVLADTIGVQRSNVTHVLHGRNKPSFQFIAKLLETYPEIDAKWLIMGTGSMLAQEDTALPEQAGQQQLFQETPKKEEPMPAAVDEPKEASPSFSMPISFDNRIPEQQKTKEVERIVVFYTDQTFKEYGPSK